MGGCVLMFRELTLPNYYNNNLVLEVITQPITLTRHLEFFAQTYSDNRYGSWWPNGADYDDNPTVGEGRNAYIQWGGSAEPNRCHAFRFLSRYLYNRISWKRCS